MLEEATADLNPLLLHKRADGRERDNFILDQEHLKRFLCGFDLYYNKQIALGVDAVERANRALCSIVGKKLTYRTLYREKA